MFETKGGCYRMCFFVGFAFILSHTLFFFFFFYCKNSALVAPTPIFLRFRGTSPRHTGWIERERQIARRGPKDFLLIQPHIYIYVSPREQVMTSECPVSLNRSTSPKQMGRMDRKRQSAHKEKMITKCWKSFDVNRRRQRKRDRPSTGDEFYIVNTCTWTDHDESITSRWQSKADRPKRRQKT